MAEVFDTIVALRLRLDAVRRKTRRRESAARDTAGRIAFVPTMGALHDGHLALVKRAAELADTVVVSIFVNPLQFGKNEDLDRYPRTFEADVAMLPEGTILFAPTVEELYPGGESGTRVTAGAVGMLFEGASRPGHFDGMLTVVAKLLNIVQPEQVVFGQKDAQQVFLVKRMVNDLNLPVVVDVVEIVREPDGLALSSRNRFLSIEQRTSALALSRALAAAASAGGVASAKQAARDVFAGANGVELDYFELVDPDSFRPAGDDYRGPVTAIIAARVGSTRLIDNRSFVVN